MKSYLLIGIIYLGSIFLMIMVISPSAGILYQGVNKLRADQEVLKSLTTKADLLTSLDETTIRSQVNIVESSLPSDKSIPGILSGLQKVAQTASSSSIDTFTMTPGKVSTESGTSKEKEPEVELVEVDIGNHVKELTFKIGMTGDISKIQEFVNSVASVNRLFKVDIVDYQGGEITTSVLTYKVFYQPLLTSLGDITEPLPTLSQTDLETFKKVSAFQYVTTPPPLIPAGKSVLFGQ